MLFLTPIDSNYLAKKGYAIMSYITKTVEHGMLSFTTIRFPVFCVVSTSRLIWYFFKTPLYLSMFILFLVFAFTFSFF